MNYYVYILANDTGETTYVGVTNDLVHRVYEHKNDADPDSFIAKCRVHKLVYFESTTDSLAAIRREKQMLNWNRKRKYKLITEFNPTWRDLYPEICGR